MKLLYEKPEIEIELLCNDVVTLSDQTGNQEEDWEI